MRPRGVVVAVVVIAAAAGCVRLGFWQLARLEQKRALNAAARRALALPPSLLTAAHTLPDSLLHRRVAVRGAFDERHQVLLAGREHEGEPGVHVVTPLVLAGDSVAVLVDRGWLPAADGVTARPQDFPAAGERAIVGLAVPLASTDREPMRLLDSGAVSVYSAERLDRRSLAARLPYPLAEFAVEALPSADAPGWPRPEPPRPLDESMHLSYAIQWFAFAAILLIGPAALAWSRRHAAGRPA